MKLHAVVLGDHLEAVLPHVDNPDDASRRRIAQRRVVDGPAREVVSLRVGQILPVAVVQDAIGVNWARANGEALAVGPIIKRLTYNMILVWGIKIILL